MDKVFLDQAYCKLIREVIDLLLPATDSALESHQIKGPSLRTFSQKLSSYTGIGSQINPKTIQKYFQQTTYSEKLYFISHFAAAWLIATKKISKLDCIQYYKNGSVKSDFFWNEYLTSLKQEEQVENPGEVSKEEIKTILYDDLAPLVALYRPPEFGLIIDRVSYLDKLYKFTEQQRLVVIDGISGVGKKSLVGSLQNKLLNSGRYKQVLWRIFELNDSVENLLQELEKIVPLGEGSVSAKTQQFIDYLKANQLLFVFYGLEKVDERSFETFFKVLSAGTGNTQLLLIRDNLTAFKFIEAKNRITIQGFSINDVNMLCKKLNLVVDDATINKLRVISDGIPFYINLLIRKSQISDSDIDSPYDNAAILAELEFKVSQWCSKFDAEDNKLLQLLSLLQMNFSENDAQALATKAGISDFYKAFKTLKEYHIVYPVNKNHWQIVRPVAEYYRTKYDKNDNNKLHEITADFMSQISSPSLLRTLNREGLVLQSKSIHHYQQALRFDKSARYLDGIIPLLKKHNLYPRLYELLSSEIKYNQDQDYWKIWHLAHCCFVLGRFTECNQHLSVCIDKSIAWYNKRIDIKSGLSFFIKSLQLFSELVGTTVSYSEAFKVLVESLSIFETPELEWHIRSHALSVLSGYYAELGEYDKSRSINDTLLKEDYEGSSLAKATTYTHIAIAEFELRHFDVAEEFLMKADKLFEETVDLRGTAWCSSYLIMTKMKLGHPVSVNDVQNVIRIKEQGQLFTHGYSKWLKSVSVETKDEQIKLLTSESLAYAESMEQQVLDNTQVSEIRKLLRTINRFIDTHPRNPFDFDTLINPISETDIPLDSILRSSMVRKIRRDPYSYLEKIGKKNPEDIFKNEKNNKALVECLAMYEFQDKIIKELILPNLGTIILLENKYDETKTKYARALHVAGDHDNAIKLLKSVDEKNRLFPYLNTMANCFWKKGELEKSESFYEFAGQAAKTNKEKGIHFHNLALRIYESKKQDKYEEAKKLCKKAIDIRQDEPRFIKYPISTLVLLETETTDSENVISVVRTLKSTYNISYALLSNIIRNVGSRTKRQKLQKEFL
ncbi:MAG: tetratricopeptide repeat protein [Chitinophagaceae bacterium]|nr:tetratricopeptide repeat protein [Chitinophagaceae bacterium]